MDLSKSYDFFQPSMLKQRVHIIGCGSIGSTLAENLARFGVEHMTLYDFDIVEPRNIANQMFTTKDLYKSKVVAVENMVHEINPDCDVKVCDKGWEGQRLSGYVFLCVDSIELRRDIANQNKNNKSIKGMFDFRTRLTDAQHYAADWSDSKSVDAFIKSMDFSHEEAEEETPMSACRVTLSVATTIRMIVACGVSNFVNFIKGEPLKKLILVDAFNFTVDAF